ncbi:MAG: type IV pilus twitching motility protein PilT [Bacillota bacterium]
MKIEDMLRQAVKADASDLHITVEAPPMIRVNGHLKPLEGFDKLTAKDSQELLYNLLDEEKRGRFEEAGELDFSYSIYGVSRFRVNAFRQRGTTGIVCRVIPTTIRTIQDLGLPDVVAQLARCTRGLILVTGPTGSGKSTTLAAMIDLINGERAEHILTLEDPIEYLHKHKKSIVNQREMGHDSKNYATALRAALREDPNVILVGEMRDLETTQIALTAAETGHLVLSTLHTQDAAQTIDRVIDIFPPHQQEQVKTQLSGTLQGIIAQLLLRRADVPGRVAAFEVLVATSAIKNLIREGKTHQIPSAIQTGAKYGMRSMESSLRELYQRGQITQEDFMIRAPGASAQLSGAQSLSFGT